MTRNDRNRRLQPVGHSMPEQNVLQLSCSRPANSSKASNVAGGDQRSTANAWHFGAFLTTGEVVFEQTVAAEDACAANFVEALVRKLCVRGIKVAEVMVDSSVVFATAKFLETCVALRLVLCVEH